MISDSRLGEIRVRWEGVRDLGIRIVAGSDGPRTLVSRGVNVGELRVTRDGVPASDSDVSFIEHAFADIPRLLDAYDTGRQLSAEDVAVIELRVAAASPGPWTAFIESDGGVGGSDVIRVSESDNEADMYLWVGSDLASPAILRFVAEARQDVPALLAAVRE